MSSLKQKLENKEFVFTAETCPPKSPDITEFLLKAKILKNYVTAINVTDNQRAMLKFSALVASGALVREGLEPILQISCRDRNSLALQADLLGASALGIKNVLPLTGDPVRIGDHPQAKGVFEFESTKLLKTIQNLNKGEDSCSNPIHGKTDFYVGAVVHASDGRPAPHLKRMEKKIEAGAKFFQTQAVFNLNAFETFMKEAKQLNTKILAGVLFLFSYKNVNFLNHRVPGINIPHTYKERLRKAKDPLQEGVKIAAEQIRFFRDRCDGVHIMAINREEKIVDIIHEAMK